MPQPLTLVAGAGGFIGGHLVRDLLDGGAAVRAVDLKGRSDWYQRFPGAENLELDLRDPSACRRACDGVSTVYNLAADMGGMGFIENNKALCMLSVLINTHLLMAARDARCPSASSTRRRPASTTPTSRPIADVHALREEDAYPAMPEDGYGWEKLFSERMCRHFREDFGLETRVARFHNVYGPHGTWDGRTRKGPGRHLPQGHRGGRDRRSRDRDLGRRPPDAQLHVHRRLRRGHPSAHAQRHPRADQPRLRANW